MRVRQMNDAFLKAFRLPNESGEGRPFFELCGGAWDVADVRTRIDSLLAGRAVFDPVELQREFPSVGMRVLIVAGVRLEELDSILLTIEDITGQREAEKALRRAAASGREDGDDRQARGRHCS
jgi:PAS domain-containing protein